MNTYNEKFVNSYKYLLILHAVAMETGELSPEFNEALVQYQQCKRNMPIDITEYLERKVEQRLFRNRVIN